MATSEVNYSGELSDIVHFESGTFTVVSGTNKTIDLTFEPTIVGMIIDSSSSVYVSSIVDNVNNISSQFGRTGSSASNIFYHNDSSIVISGKSITLPYISNGFNGLTCYWYATDDTGA